MVRFLSPSVTVPMPASPPIAWPAPATPDRSSVPLAIVSAAPPPIEPLPASASVPPSMRTAARSLWPVRVSLAVPASVSAGVGEIAPLATSSKLPAKMASAPWTMRMP